MKLIVSWSTRSEIATKSPSFSRSKSSTTTAIPPAPMCARARSSAIVRLTPSAAANRRDAANPVDVTLHEVPAEAALRGHRALEVYPSPSLESPSARSSQTVCASSCDGAWTGRYCTLRACTDWRLYLAQPAASKALYDGLFSETANFDRLEKPRVIDRGDAELSDARAVRPNEPRRNVGAKRVKEPLTNERGRNVAATPPPRTLSFGSSWPMTTRETPSRHARGFAREGDGRCR